MAAGAVLAAANGVGEGLVKDLVYEGALPGPGHTGYAGKDPERELDVHALEVVLGRAEEPYDPARLTALFRWLYPAASREEVPRHGPLLGLVVLDDDKRVPEVPEPLQRREQAAVVPLVESYRGLVEHVEHADEPAAYLRGEPYPLGLAAGERSGRAGEGEVAEANVHEKAETLPDLLDDPLPDEPLPCREVDLLEEVLRVPDGELGELGDALPPHRHGERLGTQPRARALRAGDVAHELLDLLAAVLRIRLGVPARQVAHDALEPGHVLAAAGFSGLGGGS